MKKFLQEFKDFINQGNVMDLAVAVVIGAAFTAIVNSAVSDLIMPIVGAFTGGVDFSDMKLYLPLGAGDSAIAYGSFINAVIQFVIIAFVVFLMVKALNKARSLAKHGKQAQEKEAPHCPYCLEEVAEGATRCPHCTAELPEPAGFTAKAQDARPPSVAMPALIPLRAAGARHPPRWRTSARASRRTPSNRSRSGYPACRTDCAGAF